MKKQHFVVLILSLIFSTGYYSALAQIAAFSDKKSNISYTPYSTLNGKPKDVISLNGKWKFNSSPGVNMEKAAPANAKNWNEIEVPGDWTTQGHSVEAGRPAYYSKEIFLPESWNGKIVKLRADGIQSWCKLWINGKYAGAHLGGFTAFELNITQLVKPGKNIIFIAVQNESIADSLASTTQYAAFQIGGIFRKISLFAIPQVNFSSCEVKAGLTEDYRNGSLVIYYTVKNESRNEAKKLTIKHILLDKNGIQINTGFDNLEIYSLPSGLKSSVAKETIVTNINKWDCEHPELYELVLELYQDGNLIETIRQKAGFKKTEVIGNQVFVNGKPIKLRGVNRHETHPVTGRTVTSYLCRKDVELFRNANVNYIRTSHYPPSEEFLVACDSMGMFVEVESPFCWVGHDANKKWKNENPGSLSLKDYILQATEENIRFNINHPSVLIWSLANESQWSNLWHEAHLLAARLDGTRPVTFHDQAFGGYNNFGSSEMAIANYHYPGDEDPTVRRNLGKPLLYGEYCHINTYNRREILTDPGVRDNWGQGFSRMWENCYQSKSILGAAIWAGIDDIFYLPDSTAVGYGEWGIIDGWRREKPEYFHVKKAYSPVKIFNTGLEFPVEGSSIKLNVENRYDFTNFRELNFRWKCGKTEGVINSELAPRTEGILLVPISRLSGDESSLEISVFSPKGYEIDRYVIPFSYNSNSLKNQSLSAGNKLILNKSAEKATVTGENFELQFDTKTGLLKEVFAGDKMIFSDSPTFMLLPQATEECKPKHNLHIQAFNDVLTYYSCQAFTCEIHNDTVFATSTVDYAEAAGTINYSITSVGMLHISYSLKIKNSINPRQYGVVLYLPQAFNTLSWNRKGIWSAYPADHIGRETGTATYSKNAKVNSFGKAPENLWKDDIRPLGNNDFCSTKSGVLSASLTDESGNGLQMVSDGSQSVRAFAEKEKTGLLIATFNTGGGDLFFAGHHKQEDQPLKAGDFITGNCTVKILVAQK